MKALSGEPIMSNIKHNLIRIGDLENYEGPLLVLFKHITNNRLYIMDWVDRDHTTNRWLIYQCYPSLLKKYLVGTISHFQLFSSANFYFSVDIDINLNWTNLQKLSKENIPADYFPSEDSFFDETDCPEYKKLQHFIQNEFFSKENYIRFELWNTAKLLVSYNLSPDLTTYLTKVELHKGGINTRKYKIYKEQIFVN